MKKYDTFIGLDVHARSISACALDPLTGEVTEGRFGAEAGPLAEWVLAFDGPLCVYESGPTGWHLARELKALGVDCVVGASSKMMRPPADRGGKTDRRDAEFLARLLATRNVTEVWVPDEECEAARDLSRALEDARCDLQRARQRLSKFLLRHGYVYDELTPTGARRGAWTAGAPRWKPAVDAVRCLKGIDVATAHALVVEVGDFSRFRNASGMEAWTGLVPSEHSSGETVSRGGVTKTGNAHVRRLLIEAAWHVPTAGRDPKGLARGQVVSPEVRRHATKGNRRLKERRLALEGAGKKPVVANCATAREMAGWVWALGRMAEG